VPIDGQARMAASARSGHSRCPIFERLVRALVGEPSRYTFGHLRMRMSNFTSRNKSGRCATLTRHGVTGHRRQNCTDALSSELPSIVYTHGNTMGLCLYVFAGPRVT
jgi:hypothetical protein